MSERERGQDAVRLGDFCLCVGGHDEATAAWHPLTNSNGEPPIVRIAVSCVPHPEE
jgi:hypothetical protein